MPRVQLSVRRMMVAVAIMAVAIGAEITRRRWTSYSEKAAEYAKREAHVLQMASKTEGEVAASKRKVDELMANAERTKSHLVLQRSWADLAELESRNANLKAEEAMYYRQQAAYYGHLKDTFQRAAARPWEFVEPDPTPP
jgi:hypothetical protein